MDGWMDGLTLEGGEDARWSWEEKGNIPALFPSDRKEGSEGGNGIDDALRRRQMDVGIRRQL